MTAQIHAGWLLIAIVVGTLGWPGAHAAEDGKADVVLGSRFLGSQEHRVVYFWHMVGNRFLTLLSNVLTDLNLTDMECGHKAFRAEILKDLAARQLGY